MKCRLVGVVALSTLLLAPLLGAAEAADMAVKAPPPAPPPATPQWAGCYVGIAGGYGWGTGWETGAPPSPVVPAAEVHATGGLFGGTVGCQLQSGTIVYGVEDDLSWSGVSGSAPAFPAFGGPAYSASGAQNWLDTLRGRVGVVYGSALFYATGGAAFTSLKGSDIAPAVVAAPATITYTATGWTLGGGVEVQFAAKWSAKVEYLYLDYGTRDTNFNAISPAYANIDTRATASLIRVGLNYHFSQ